MKGGSNDEAVHGLNGRAHARDFGGGGSCRCGFGTAGGRGQDHRRFPIVQPVNGRQYIATAAGNSLFAFALRHNRVLVGAHARLRALDDGYQWHLSKPVEPSELVSSWPRWPMRHLARCVRTDVSRSRLVDLKLARSTVRASEPRDRPRESGVSGVWGERLTRAIARQPTRQVPASHRQSAPIPA